MSSFGHNVGSRFVGESKNGQWKDLGILSAIVAQDPVEEK